MDVVFYVATILALFAFTFNHLNFAYSIAHVFHAAYRQAARKWARLPPLTFRKMLFGAARVNVELPAIILGPRCKETGLIPGGDISYFKDIPNDFQTSTDDTKFERIPGIPTWMNFLDETWKMERHSRDWEKLAWHVQHGTPQPEIQENGTLAVGMQTYVQRYLGKSQDVPWLLFAVTSMRYLIELVALLGLHWIMFDPQEGYYANGNGFILTGKRRKGIGIVFEFQIHKCPSFKANRVIPTPEIRELCFGVIPTFYRDIESDEAYMIPLETPTSLEALRLGTREKVIKTLLTIGCSKRSIRAYQKEEKSVLLFPGKPTTKTVCIL